MIPARFPRALRLSALLTCAPLAVAASPPGLAPPGDCNANGVPDDEEAILLFSESFESGPPATWSATGLWHVTDQCARPSTCDGPLFAYFGLDGTCNFESGVTEVGTLATPPIDVPASALTAELVYCSAYEGEGYDYDLAAVWVNGVEVDEVSDEGWQSDWEVRTVDLSAFIGQQIEVEFRFDSLDSLFNFGLGWQVDNVQVNATGVDCNGNGVPDVCDVFAGTSSDCNGNGFPDECEPDCNGNGVADDCDISGGLSLDCNSNGLPDECEPDCNGNGVPDDCDLASGTSFDCNANGIPDECDTGGGSSPDCNGNDVPDECEIGGAILSQSFEAGLPTGWTATGLWHVTDLCPRPSTCDGDFVAYFGQDGTCDFDTGGGVVGTLAAPAFMLPPTLTSADLIFCSAYEGDPGLYDLAAVTVNGVAVDVVSDDGNQLDWEVRMVDLSSFIGQAITLRFEFDSLDEFQNGFLGWQIDSVQVLGVSSNDCNDNGTPDDCETDCNSNGVPDDCDIADGTSLDCNSNSVPDECETDCNTNGVPDDCDIAGGTSDDCNSNSIPDECDIAAGTSLDCNSNGVPDECDVAGGTSLDCNANGVPDECETDCNTNGVPDDCDIAGGTSDDCNSNSVPDECDITAGTSLDCNSNGIPDECETDCNTNGVPDDCDIAGGTSADCNSNSVPDECDTAAGTSLDCNSNGTPDECEPDCNTNGVPDDCDLTNGTSLDCNSNSVPDECDIAAGTSLDCNSNGTPDECEPDCNTNGVPDDCDIAGGTSLDCNSNSVPDECDIAAGTSLDCNSNGTPDECETDCNTNGVPDDCDLTNGTSLDCNSNGVPDECDIAGGTSTDVDGNGVPDECELLAAPYCFCAANAPCGNLDPTAGCLNSTGAGGLLQSSGTSSVAADDLVITASQLPVNQFGIIYMGPGQIEVPFGDGLRCVGAAGVGVFRYPVASTGPQGTLQVGPGIVQYTIDNFPAQGQIQSGQTWNFQGWFRDPQGLCGSGFNLSNADSITFTP